MLVSCVTSSVEETEGLGIRLAADFKAGDNVALLGELGAGKTALVRGILLGLGSDATLVSSPTFSILNEYLDAKFKVLHFDFYRLSQEAQIWTQLDLEECFQSDKICLVEWPDRLNDFKQHFNHVIDIQILEGDRRLFQWF